MSAAIITSSSSKLNAQDTLVCDNGGFEEEFMYYEGRISYYEFGSNFCYPIDISGFPSYFNFNTVPSFRRFEIVTSGIDPLVGIQRTKFGSKALLLNHRYGVTGTGCGTTHATEINKIIKRFKVDSNNREFSVWFAVVLENPNGHANSQPYFHISCDLAPDFDLCFDATDLTCPESYSDPNCMFLPIDVLDWSCHKILIDESYIGQIATLEISAADCGCSAHFGYAYIDGICEECDGSALGSGKIYDQPIDNNGLGIDYLSCTGDTIKVCGTYVLPEICGFWDLDSFRVPGFNVLNKTIDKVAKKFCFEVLRSSLPGSGCKDLFVFLYFRYGNHFLSPVATNPIYLCNDHFKKFENQMVVGACQNNGTMNLISDDYYYVQVNMSNYENHNWTMVRQMDDPYPNETGNYIIRNGSGDGMINLGPFLIQDGSWTLSINVRDCSYSFPIDPPDYCSGCPAFKATEVYDVSCNNSTNPNTWSFKLRVPYSGQGPNSFTIDQFPTQTFLYGIPHTIQVGNITTNCVEFTLRGVLGCFTEIKVCPPKPCSDNAGCMFEFYLNDIYCVNEGTEYYFSLITKNASGPLCYMYSSPTLPNSSCSLLPTGYLGPFNEDITLTIYKSNNSNCSCDDPTCFKTILISEPDCENLEFRTKIHSFSSKEIVQIIPNPFIGNRIVIKSKLSSTDFEIINISGQSVFKGYFEGVDHTFDINLSSGLYILNYWNKESSGSLKFIKL